MAWDAQKWAKDNAKADNRYTAKQYSPFVCHIANMFDPRARMDCHCEWVSPYGWVPEAGCPDHD